MSFLIKRKYRLMVLLLVVVNVAACSLLQPQEQSNLLPGQSKLVMAKGVNGKNKPSEPTNEFKLGEMVYAYTSIGWSDTQRPISITAKWYNSKNVLVASQSRVVSYVHNPHHVWFWINSAQIEKGSGRIEILGDGRSMSTSEFVVSEVDKRGEKKPWYRSALDVFDFKSSSSQKSIEPLNSQEQLKTEQQFGDILDTSGVQ